MRNFLLGLIVAIAIAAGAYYFLMYQAPAEDQTWEEWGEQQRTPTNRIPENAIMEDGTLPDY